MITQGADKSIIIGDITTGTYWILHPTGNLELVGSATYWRDIDFPIVIRTTGVGIPTLETFKGNITAPQWQAGDFNVCEGQELVHEWKEDSRVYWHVHMTTNGVDTTDRFVKWQIEYIYNAKGNGGTLSPTFIDTFEFKIPANTPDRTMFIVPISSFVPVDAKIGNHIYARLDRVVSTGTAPTANPFCTMLQLHVECNSFGSNYIDRK